MPHHPVVESVRSGDISIITLSNPPVNTLGRPARRALLVELERAENDEAVSAVVIAGRNNFSAGADLAEFDSGEGLAEPTLHLTLTGYLDTMTKPTVAAIDGVALGGGLELALACSARVAHPRAKLGLPETTLGFMPGAGGTQRLPRAVGIEAALDLIVTGRSISSAEAETLGLLEAVDPDPVGAATQLARRLVSAAKPRLRDRAIAEPLAEAFVDSAKRFAARNPKASAGVKAALEALRSAVTKPFDEALADELEFFVRLAGEPEARAARYRFLSDRAAVRLRPVENVPDVTTAAVIGAGTMGRGIALALLSASIEVTLIDTDADRVNAGIAAMTADLDRAVARMRLTEGDRDAQLKILSSGVGLEKAASADLVIEAVFENLDVKRDVFRALSDVVRPDTILASNTSSLDLNLIAQTAAHPERVVGMHFFSPANIMRLVEVVDGGDTSPATLAAAVKVAKRLRKLPVVAQVGPGFIGNRIFDQYIRQAQLLLREGVSPQQIDSALERWGMAMGPFRVLDLVGNDISWMARKAAGGAGEDVAWQIADALGENGWFGRKSGSGWYRYGDDGSAGPNPDLTELLASFTGPQISDDEIVRRCILALVIEASHVLADRVAATSADIDTVMVNGYGFPARRGGPWFFAELTGWELVQLLVKRWRERTGDSFWSTADLPLTEKNAS